MTTLAVWPRPGATVAPDTTPPSAVTLTATASDGTVTVTASGGTDTSPVTFDLWRATSSPVDTSGAPRWSSVTWPQVDDTVADGATYHYVARATDASGNVTWSNETSVTVGTTARFPGDPTVIGGTYWGASSQDDARRDAIEAEAGSPYGCHRQFDGGFTPSLNIARAAADHAADRLPILSMKPDPATAAAGGHDADFDELIEGLEALDAPTVVVLFHEPENEIDDGVFTVDDWKGMQTRFRQRLDEWGQIQRIVFAPVLINFTWQHPSRNPDDFWVDGIWDVFGLDSYLYATMSYPRGQYLDFIEWLRARPTPIPWGVCEWGVRQDSEDPDNYVSVRAWWEAAKAEPDLVWMAYFDSDANATGSGWELRSGSNARAEFVDILAEPESINLSDLGY